MENTAYRAIAIVGMGAVLPDAPNVAAFWQNIKDARSSITEVSRDRWDPDVYYDPDPRAPDKTYSKIGGWVREYAWDPMKWRMPIPPRVAEAMDESQKWAIGCVRQTLEDYGYPKRPLDLDRTAVILGNAMGGERHYLTALRVYFQEYAHELAESATFAALPEAVRRDITREFQQRVAQRLPEITEDSMPGELANCLAGRIANLFNIHGPNYTCDAACASAMAAISSAVEGLIQKEFDAAITGGIDRNMGASTFVKFCKIGALSATGSRPFAEGADGFVMGEGAAVFLLKRLEDAERDGDNICAVLRGMGASSDGKGKGITAPNPVGPKLAIERAWENAGLSPATVSLIECHGTSTRVGDVVEAQSMSEVLKDSHLPEGSIAIGSVKSNFGHLKGGAGAAGLLKAALALREKVLPPSLNYKRPNPGIDFAHSPFYVNTELKTWPVPATGVRRAGLSAFGFGGTNFHAVLEEYIPHRITGNGKRTVAVTGTAPTVPKDGTMNAKDTSLSPAHAKDTSPVNTKEESPAPSAQSSYKAPLRGALVIGAASDAALAERLAAIQKDAAAGHAPAPAAPLEADLRAPERLAIDYADAADLADKSAKALKALAANQPAIWKALRALGIFRGHGPAPKVAFLYTGQGSQYLNMLQVLRASEPIVAETFAEADRVMTPLLGKRLTEFIFVNTSDEAIKAKAEEELRQTAITQPAVISADIAMTRLLAAYGIQPDMTMGHSVGEYGALVAAGALPFEDALEAVSARGREMTNLSIEDKGLMVAVFAPLEQIEQTLKTIDGYVVVANINSYSQAVIGGASTPVRQALEAFQKAGYEAVELPVSHAFHTTIIAPASEPLRRMMERLRLQSPRLPIVANVDGNFYPTGPDVVPQMLDMLARQVASPVQFVKGLLTLYEAGVRVFIEMGPKKALQGFAEDVLGSRGDVLSLFTNHPKFGDVVAFNQALCGLYSAGLGWGGETKREAAESTRQTEAKTAVVEAPAAMPAVPVAAASVPDRSTPPVIAKAPIAEPTPAAATPAPKQAAPLSDERYLELGRLFADVLERAGEISHGRSAPPPAASVAITGAALGLPGTERVFDDTNIARILRGDQFIAAIPERIRQAMLDKRITRLVKSENGGPVFESITDVADVIKLAARGGAFDLEKEFGVSAERIAALDSVTALAIAAGLDALRDAGIPLVLRYKTTSKGTKLPERWVLPEALRDDTGVIFASAFPGCDSFAQDMSAYYADHGRRELLAALEDLRRRVADNGHAALVDEIDRRIGELRTTIEKEPFVFDRRFLFRVLPMGHSQFAEFICARGPNTQINSACASTTQAVALAEDWIDAGRCRRVIVLSADNVTSDHLLGWMGAGFLASGAAATDETVEDAAIPFDRRRHGMLLGMGAAALVVESSDAVRERGIRPICEVLSAVTANSAFHGTRLDIEHICQVMEDLVAQAEARHGISRREIAPRTVFVSHETYTPARGGSASAEIYALRRVFGEAADQIVIANTKGFTGHAMATGVEDVVAVKTLETGLVPPVANFKEVDPELGTLNLSKGGAYPVEYALHLGAGFGSQISMELLRWVRTEDGARPAPTALGYAGRIADTETWNGWLSRISGYKAADLEVVLRTLRVRDQGAPSRVVEVAKPAQASLVAPPAIPTPPVALAAKAAAASASPAAAPAVVSTKMVPSPAATPPVAPVPPATPVLTASAAPTPAKAAPPVVKVEPPAPVVTAKPAPPLPIDAAKPAVKVEAVVPAAPAPQPAAPDDSVKARILALVADKTGYPMDMLDLELDLEADLGVDTVKQAEVLATIREAYGIARDDTIKLRDFPTLAHVIRFVYSKRPDLAEDTPVKPAVVEPAKENTEVKSATPAEVVPAKEEVQSAAVATAVSSTAEGDSVKDRILALVVEKTGYPKDMLDLELDLEADLGVDTVKQAEMFAAIREIYNIPRDPDLKLRDFPTLARVIQFVYDKRPDLAAAGAKPVIERVPVALVQAVAAKPATKQTEKAVETVPVDAAPVLAVIPAAEAGRDAVKERILALVVEKTGYPRDMLDLELDLEADLGVDTVKQAEMFAAIREIYNIPRDQDLKLRDFPTLAKVIQFVYDKRPDLSPAAVKPVKEEASFTPGQREVVLEPMKMTSEVSTPAPAVAAIPAVEGAGEAIKERILDLVVEKTGYPKDMLDLELDLEADLGVDTVKQAEMFAAIREIYSIPRDQDLKLRDFPTLARVIQFVYDKRPDLAPGATQPVKKDVEVAPAKKDVAAELPKEQAEAVPAPVESTPALPFAPAADGGDAVKERILALVVEKTGYPKDMLDLELDLEADLGVDTVKQAEMFAAIREIYNIPRDQDLKLRDFPTLARVIQFVYDKRPDLAPAAAKPPKQEAPTPATVPPAVSSEAPAPTPSPSAAPEAASVEAITDESIQEKVLEIVAEKTGYPKEMLDLDLDLEADLGIDTVKQAEMFAAIRAIYNIPRDQDLKLRDFPTLAHVIKFARDRRPQKTEAHTPAPVAVAAPPVPKPVARPRPALASLDPANRIPRRVPVPNLRPPLAICKPTPVTLGPGSRVVLMPDKGGVGEKLAHQLATLGVEVLRFDDVPDGDELINALKKWLAAGPVQGVYWLPALDKEAAIADMGLAAWREALRVRLKALFVSMRTLYEQVAAPGTFLVSGTRLGGQHGYDQAGAVAPLGGAVVGFTKTYKRERMDCLVKAVDFELDRNSTEIAEILIQETLHDPGAVEIGYKEGERWTVGLQEQPAADGQPGLTLDESTVFLITGAAGSIVSAITADLAAASGGTFYLLDLVPQPDANNPDLKRFVSDKEGLKRDLFARIQARGERATPALVEKELAALERAQAAQSAIDAVKNAGGTAHYISVNLTDAAGVAKVIGQVRQRSGRIDVLLHAAGIERSHFLPAKEPREFDLVFDVKSDGWFNLLHATGDMPLGTTVAFSSIAGRFGNAGQTDYSSANDLLCKITSSFRTVRPATRGIVIDWTAWGGIGMATRGSIPKMMELAGIDMLPPEAGVPLIRRELTSGGTCGEVVIGQRLGMLLNEWDDTGGLDITAVDSADAAPQGPMIGKVASMGLQHGLVIETTLDPKIQPFLHDHQIDGTPVLPGVMGIEAFAETARRMFPAWQVAAVEKVNFLSPFKFYRGEPRTLVLEAVFYPQDRAVLADCRLIGRRLLPNQKDPQITTHFTARVRLAKQVTVVATTQAPGAPAESIIQASDIYRFYFHGPAYQVVQRAWRRGDQIVGELAEGLPANHVPSERPLLMAPRMIELCFQTAGLWEMGTQSRMGLPHKVDEVCLCGSPETVQGKLFAVVTPDPKLESFDAQVVDVAGNVHVQMRGYRTVALPAVVDAKPLRVLQAAA